MQASAQGRAFFFIEQHRLIHVNICVDVKHAWRPLTDTRKATNNGDGLQDAQYNLTSVKDVFVIEHS